MAAAGESTDFAKAGELMKEFAENLGALQKTMKSMAKVFSDPNFGSDGKKTKKKRKLDDGSPKRAVSSYLYYFKEQLPLVKSEFPGMVHKEMMTKLGERWRSLDDKSKQVYEEKANASKATYEKEMEVNFFFFFNHMHYADT